MPPKKFSTLPEIIPEFRYGIQKYFLHNWQFFRQFRFFGPVPTRVPCGDWVQQLVYSQPKFSVVWTETPQGGGSLSDALVQTVRFVIFAAMKKARTAHSQ